MATKTVKKQTTNSSKIVITILFAVIIILFYWNSTNSSLENTYAIKSTGSDGGYRASFINRTGKDVEEKKIKLSDNYWTSGKFGF